MSDKDTPMYEWGFALSGGAARCFAHLGVIKAFGERGITPGIFSGTSGGAIAGVFIADGYEPEEALELFSKTSVMNFTDFMFPKTGISRTTKIREFLSKNLRAKKFEKLGRPLIVTAADFDNGRSVQFSSGDLITPIIASCCVPVVFTPTIIDGISYVDGGLFQNLPAKPIRGMCRYLVGVDVNPIQHDSDLNSLRHVAERMFSLVITSNTKADKKLCDINICPGELVKYAMHDIQHSKEIYQAGYDAAVAELEAMDWSLYSSGASSLIAPAGKE